MMINFVRNVNIYPPPPSPPPPAPLPPPAPPPTPTMLYEEFRELKLFCTYLLWWCV